MDITKIGEELGWEPRHTLKSGLSKTVDWYLTNPEWVDAIRRKEGYQDWLVKNYSNRSKDTEG
jgi:dTDP-glucose 4,6-dehydratase